MKRITSLFKRLKLAQKISLLVIFITVLATGICSVVSGRWYIAQMLDNLEQNALNVVRITAMSPIVIDGLESGVDDGSIQQFVTSEQELLDQIDIMVVADADGVRYGHTKSDRVGELFSAEDHVDALTKGETYVTIGPGTLGDSMRAFTPVYSRDGSRITGFVMSGTLLDSIAQAERTISLMAVGFTLLSSLIGVLCAVFLSRYIKKSLLFRFRFGNYMSFPACMQHYIVMFVQMWDFFCQIGLYTIFRGNSASSYIIMPVKYRSDIFAKKS